MTHFAGKALKVAVISGLPCFTYLASKGVRLESIQALAGHASIDTTMLYNEAAQLMVPAGTAFNKSHSYEPIKRIE